MTKNEMIAKAIKKAQELGCWYPTAKQVAIYDSNNKLWKEYWGEQYKSNPEYSEELEMLHGYNYQAIYIHPTNIESLGGDLWVFFDRDTGNIIGTE